ncbi:amidase [Humitalea sp. 24SJ18S-53]|uniref:amidase n=1 Tax=Humitalea sp. 24SJ18S-53 TaxID=3422307 RepID=UPI003D66856F
MLTTDLDPATLTASQAADAIAEGRLTSEALLRACLDRIALRDDAVGAWAFLDPDLALAAARAADRGPVRGPLHGVPVGLKDIIDTYDMPTQCNSPIHAGRRPYADSAVAALIRAAGGIILGKTVTTEFANRFPGATRNPLNPAHTPGGSSSGSAAAVADGQVPLALGTQTSGSMIRPAAYCGVVGYKPSFGEVSRVGVFQQSGTLDTVGLCARSLEDVQRLRAVVSRIPYVPVGASATAPRIALCRTPEWAEASPAAQQALTEAAARLAAAGATVTDLELPAALFGGWPDAHRRIANFEGARNFGFERHRHRALISKALGEGRIRDGETTPLDAYIAAQRAAEAMRAWADEALDAVDVVLTLSAAGEAPVGLAATGSATFNSLWTLLYTPCLTLPHGAGPTGLPLGLQLVSARYEDERLFAAAGWVQSALAA